MAKIDDLCFRPLAAETVRQEYALFKQVTKDLPWDDWDLENFLVELPDKWRLSTVSYSGQTVVGYVIASRKDAHSAHIHRFMVHPEFRAQGLGSALLRYFSKHAPRDIHFISLAVAEENSKAVAFYVREGFEQVEKTVVEGEHYKLLRKRIDRVE